MTDHLVDANNMGRAADRPIFGADGCAGCRHAPPNWQEFSQLPTCTHPDVLQGRFHPARGIWCLYPITDGPCGPKHALREPASDRRSSAAQHEANQ